MFITVAVIKVIYMVWITISEMACTDFVDIPDTYAVLTLIVSSFN